MRWRTLWNKIASGEFWPIQKGKRVPLITTDSEAGEEVIVVVELGFVDLGGYAVGFMTTTVLSPENNWGYPSPGEVLAAYEQGDWSNPSSHLAMTALAKRQGKTFDIPIEIMVEEFAGALVVLREYDEGKRTCRCELPMCDRKLAFQVLQAWDARQAAGDPEFSGASATA